MSRDGTYGENVSTGPVTIGTDFADVIAREKAMAGSGSGAPNELALRAPKRSKKRAVR